MDRRQQPKKSRERSWSLSHVQSVRAQSKPPYQHALLHDTGAGGGRVFCLGGLCVSAEPVLCQCNLLMISSARHRQQLDPPGVPSKASRPAFPPVPRDQSPAWPVGLALFPAPFVAALGSLGVTMICFMLQGSSDPFRGGRRLAGLRVAKARVSVSATALRAGQSLPRFHIAFDSHACQEVPMESQA